MFKSQDILLFIIIIILIIILCHCNYKKKEGFQDVGLFNETKLNTVSTKIKKEYSKIKEIQGKFDKITDRRKTIYLNINGDKQYVIGNKGDPDGKTLSSLVDTNKLVKLNNELSKSYQDIPLSKYYDNTVKSVIDERIKNVYGIRNKNLYEKIKKDQEEATKAISKIKNVESSLIFNVDRIDKDTGTYKIKYDIEDTENKMCNTKCFKFDDDKFKAGDEDYYFFDDCNVENTQLKAHNIKLNHKCFNNDKVGNKYIEAKDTDGKPISFEECDKDLTKHIAYDKDSFITDYNKISLFDIDENDISNLHNDFVVITQVEPKKIKDDEGIDKEQYQCLTVDNEGLSFQNCHLHNNQRFNYERSILQENANQNTNSEGV